MIRAKHAARICAVMSVLCLLSCGSSDKKESGGGVGGQQSTAGTGGATAAGGVDAGGAAATAGNGGITVFLGGGDGGLASDIACQLDADCPPGRLCHPVTGVCAVPGGVCAVNTDCAENMYCEASLGTCMPGATGTPCDSDLNCNEELTCVNGTCGCSALEQTPTLLPGALDIYLIFDRTLSMGRDCQYQQGGTPPTNSKACYATYALPDYLMNVPADSDTRLAFQFMSISENNNDCDGTAYATPLIDLTQLPIPLDHPMIQAIIDETFQTRGTHIEGALRGMAEYTSTHVTEGREMIGVLLTDGDPYGCEEDIGALSTIISDHLAATGLRTFIIGMEGATDANLEQLALAGGADPHDDYCGSLTPPCHYFNVGNGSGDAIASALHAIVQQSAPLPCTYDVANLTPPEGQTLDYNQVNVTLTDPVAGVSTIGRVSDPSLCPADLPAWYYDNPQAPTTLNLCPTACASVSAVTAGTTLSLIVGCEPTIDIPL